MVVIVVVKTTTTKVVIVVVTVIIITPKNSKNILEGKEINKIKFQQKTFSVLLVAFVEKQLPSHKILECLTVPLENQVH